MARLRQPSSISESDLVKKLNRTENVPLPEVQMLFRHYLSHQAVMGQAGQTTVIPFASFRSLMCRGEGTRFSDFPGDNKFVLQFMFKLSLQIIQI